MEKTFYTSEGYKQRQSSLAKENWEKGLYDFFRKQIKKTCSYHNCGKIFFTTPSNPKKFCSSSCAAKVTNRERKLSVETKDKISRALTGKVSPYKGVIKVARAKIVCEAVACNNEVVFKRWEVRKFCSNACAMSVIGAQPTSPRAARAKAGIREDLGEIYFYSRWEANFARLLNLLNIKWQHQPKTFDLKTQKYTPDFYLPEHDTFVEIKNFLSEYSLNRDKKFREFYPDTPLLLIVKDDYLELQNAFAHLIGEWEYS